MTCEKEAFFVNQTERRSFLIRYLLSEQPQYEKIVVPNGTQEQRELLRSLFNVRPVAPVSDEFLRVQDEYLCELSKQRGITDITQLMPVSDELYLWQGDITTLSCDAIVNAANSGMTGCYRPMHNCIDNPIPLQITRGFSSFTKASA